MAQWTENRFVRTGVRSASGRFALRVGRDLRDIEVVDRGMTLAAHAFTSILPILIVVGALRATLDPQADAIFAEHLGFSDATAEMLDEVPARRGAGIAGDRCRRRGSARHRGDLVRAGTRAELPDDLAHAEGQHQVRMAVARGDRGGGHRDRAHRRDAHHRARGRCAPRVGVHRRGRDLGCAVVDRGVDRDESRREPSSAPARRGARRGGVRDSGTGGPSSPPADPRRGGPAFRNPRRGIQLHRVAVGAVVHPPDRSDGRSSRVPHLHRAGVASIRLGLRSEGPSRRRG